MTGGRDLVVLGLSLSSSWGNGHATTYRALLRGLADLGYRVRFLERDMPWYAAQRDLGAPDFAKLEFYDSPGELQTRHKRRIADADAVIVGSYVPEGIDVLDFVLAEARGVVGFYDIDTPVTLAALAQDACGYLRQGQISRLGLYLSFTGGPALQLLADRYGARNPRLLHCAVDERLYRPFGVPVRWDLGYLGTYSADRQPALERLLIEPARRLPSCRFVVAGAQYPADIAWPPNVERIEHLPPTAHPMFYAAQRFTLNVTRADMLAAGWSPSVRLFEAAACGAPIISDRWPGLTELLPEPDAIVVADDTPDVIRTLIALGEPERQRISGRAREIVLAAHTASRRASQLHRYFQEARRVT
jgi:spore maturation protein CgeB